MQERAPRSGPGRPSSIENPARTIRAAAAALIAEKGYDGTSMQDVAAAVGVTKPGVYHYFPSKQALYEAIVLGTLEDLRLQAVRAVGGASDHPARLTAFMTAHARFLDENRATYRASFFGRGGEGRADYSPEQLAARKAYVRLLESMLEDGVKAGAFDIPDIPVFARGVLGMLNWMARWYRPGGPLRATEIAESYAGTILNGIRRK